jgi:hypothetical protein
MLRLIGGCCLVEILSYPSTEERHQGASLGRHKPTALPVPKLKTWVQEVSTINVGARCLNRKWITYEVSSTLL